MATDFYSDNFATATRGTSNSDDFSISFLYTITQAFIINDRVFLCQIPAAAAGTDKLITLLEWYIDVPDLDAATAIALQLGDSTAADALMAAETSVGQAAGKIYTQVNGVAGYLPKSYAVNDNIILKVSTAPTTGATTGVIKGWARFQTVGAKTPF